MGNSVITTIMEKHNNADNLKDIIKIDPKMVLLTYFICFSPEKLDIEFSNKFYVTLKPLIYLIMLYLISGFKFLIILLRSSKLLKVIIPFISKNCLIDGQP